ncbi:MAG: hypothetical protein GXO26_04800 [Crenarchaeota archaeon]|nr:hypothetical protein [Thermoproteota archaeon]
MIRLVTGVKALDLVYEKVKKEKGIIITPFEGTYTIFREIKISSSTIKHILLTLILKLFEIDNEEYSIIREALKESETLREFFTRLEEHTFRDTNLNYLIDLYHDIALTKDEEKTKEEYLTVRTWISDPQLTFLAIVALLSILKNCSKSSPVLLYLIDVENVLDILLIFREYNLYIYSLRKPIHLENFDEIYLYNIPRLVDKYGIVKIYYDNIIKCREPSMNMMFTEPKIGMRLIELDDISREILSTLSELGFMSLNALRESIAHQFGVDKNVVDSCVLKLERLGLVELRYLSDGRVIVLPTLMGLVKAKKFC